MTIKDTTDFWQAVNEDPRDAYIRQMIAAFGHLLGLNDGTWELVKSANGSVEYRRTAAEIARLRRGRGNAELRLCKLGAGVAAMSGAPNACLNHLFVLLVP